MARIALALCGLLLGCHYELDKLYEHGSSPRDAGNDADMQVDDSLFRALDENPEVSAACLECAEEKCAGTEMACASDEECAALFACSVASLDPGTLATCRAERVAWLSEGIVERALGGSFYSCVFRDSCDRECKSHTDLSCVGDFSYQATSRQSVRVTMRFYDAFDNKPAAKIHVKVCIANDPTCDDPSFEADADEDGVVELTLSTAPLGSFRGYLELSGDMWYPTLIHLGFRVGQDGVFPLPIITKTNVQRSIALSGTRLEEERGLLQLRMFGCEGVGVQGVSFRSDKQDEESRVWYFDDPLPSFERMDTTDNGNGGMINVPAGQHTITATTNGGRDVIARTSAPVRAGTMTIVWLTPVEE